MGQQLRLLEALSRYLLVGRGGDGGNVMVRDRNLFALNKEDALVGFRPHAIQTLDLVLSP
jgi:hypothetical protein